MFSEHDTFFFVSGKDKLPGVSDRENLPYTEATLHESMRLGMAAPVGVPHSTLCDTQVGMSIQSSAIWLIFLCEYLIA